jgi:hypothetical protein
MAAIGGNEGVYHGTRSSSCCQCEDLSGDLNRVISNFSRYLTSMVPNFSPPLVRYQFISSFIADISSCVLISIEKLIEQAARPVCQCHEYAHVSMNIHENDITIS